MVQLLVLVVLVAVVGVAAVVLGRRRTPPAPIRTGTTVPERLERADFARPDAPWLVVSFSSTTCLACKDTRTKIAPLESPDVAVQDVPYPDEKRLHERYRIDAVPVVVVADAAGTVRASFVGPPSAADLWASLADLRDPGSVPPGCDHHGSVT